MKLSYLPAELHLSTLPDGSFEVRLKGEAVFTTRSEKAAVKRFTQLRSDHGGDIPQAALTPSEKERLLKKEVGEALVDANHYEPQKLKKARRSSRTFR
jgi:hypothetical protein